MGTRGYRSLDGCARTRLNRWLTEAALILLDNFVISPHSNTILATCSGLEDHERGEDKDTLPLPIGVPCGFDFRFLRRCGFFSRVRPRSTFFAGIANRFRDIVAAPAHESEARNRPGLMPVSRQKMEVRWLWSTNPASWAIHARGGGCGASGFSLARADVHDIALRPKPSHLLDRRAEVIGAQTGNIGQDSK